MPGHVFCKHNSGRKVNIVIYRFLLTGLFYFVAATSLIVVAAPSYAYTVLTPPSDGKPLVNARRAESHLVIKAADKNEAESLKVGKVINRDGETKPVLPIGTREKDGSFYVHYLLELKKGKNTFTLNPGEKDLVVHYKPLRTLLKLDPNNPDAYLFHRNDIVPEPCTLCHTDQLPKDSGLDVKLLSRNTDFSPVCYSCHRKLTSENKWLHGPSAAVACMTCHRKGEGNRKITTLVGRVDDSCYQCHINKRKWVTNEFVHGPAGTGDCTVCHDPHGAEFPYMLWADSKIDICVACHTDKKKINSMERGYKQHGIISGNGCSACHSPHASNYRFQLAGQINDVCVSCHIGMKEIKSGHPVGKHPLSEKKDPRRKNREMSCTSCHNPHGSKYEYILIGSVLGGHICSKCHH